MDFWYPKAMSDSKPKLCHEGLSVPPWSSMSIQLHGWKTQEQIGHPHLPFPLIPPLAHFIPFSCSLTMLGPHSSCLPVSLPPASVSKLIASVFPAAPNSAPSLPSRSGSWVAAKFPFYLSSTVGLFFAVCGRLFVLFCPRALPFSDFLIKSGGNWIFSSRRSCLWLSVSTVPLNVCLDHRLQFQPSLFSVSFLLLSFRVSLCFDHRLVTAAQVVWQI